MTDANPFPYDGPPEWRATVETALRRVVDPEVAMSIVDVGLVYGVTLTDGQVTVDVTMTSPACPVAGVIVDDIDFELYQSLPEGWDIVVDLVWEPPWTPERMTDAGRRAMGW